MSGKGDIRLISTDGTYTTIAIEDEDVEVYNQFGASKGRIYYIDVNQVLKVVEPGQSKPVRLIENVWSFTISPDGEYIAVSTATNTEGNSGGNLLIYDRRPARIPYRKRQSDFLPVLVAGFCQTSL